MIAADLINERLFVVTPIARGIGADDLPWWKLAYSVWIRINATASAASCDGLPLVAVQNCAKP